MPPITNKFLQEIVSDEFRVLRGADRRFQRAIYNYLQSYKRNVRAYARNQIGSSRAVDLRTFDAIQVSRDLQRILVDSGLGGLVDLHKAELDRIETKALRYFEKAGITSNVSGISRSAVRGYVTFSEFEIRRVMDSRLVDPVQNMFMATALGETPRSELIDVVARTAVANQVDASRHSIEVTIHDLHRGYQRHVTNTKAEELGLDWFIYDGPLDRITSEQCEHLLTLNKHGVPALLRRSEISSDLHPKIPRGRNPLVYGGHINCRHKYYPVTEEEVERRRGA